MADPAELRVSDQQRERAAQELREHFAAGRITEDELDERVQAAYSARTQEELSRLAADLPQLPVTRQQLKADTGIAAAETAGSERQAQERRHQPCFT